MCSTCDCDTANITTSVQSSGEPRDSSTEPTTTLEARVGAKREGGDCRRCGSEPFIILDKIHIECKSCFLESCNKKLRSTIGKSKLMTNNDPILIAHSGSASSTALLDLIKNSIEFNFRREQKFRPSIVHVDTRSIMSSQEEEQEQEEERLTNLDKFLRATQRAYPQWPIYWTTIEMIARESDCDNVKNNSEQIYIKFDNGGNDDQVRNSRHLFDTQALNCLRTKLLNLDLTDKQDLIRKSTIELIAQVAKSINNQSVASNGSDKFKCIFSASSATQLANNLLVDVILGEGGTCHSTVSICDNRWAIPIIRPMKEFSRKEIAFYLRARQLEIKSQTNLATLSDSKASIQKLTESFLSKLSVDYPSTYSTLLRTGNKLQ